MTGKKEDKNADIVIWGGHRLSKPRSKLISRGREFAESLDKLALTVIRDIIVEIDRQGFLKKRAILDPVSTQGEQITEASLGYVGKEGYDYRIGDIVAIECSSDPFRFRFPPNVIKEKRTGYEKVFEMPDKCPACGSTIAPFRPDPNAAYRCTGTACPGRIKAQLLGFSVSMHMDLNPEVVRELVDRKMVWDPADLYFLEKKDLMQLNRMDEEATQRFLDSIEKSRHPEMIRMCYALFTIGDFSDFHAQELGIELGFRIKSINDLLDADSLAPVLSQISGRWWFEPYLISNIYKFIRDSKTPRFLEKLKKGGVIFPRKNS